MKTVQIATLAASLATMIMMIAVVGKLQAAKEDAQRVLANPLNALLNLVKGS